MLGGSLMVHIPDVVVRKGGIAPYIPCPIYGGIYRFARPVTNGNVSDLKETGIRRRALSSIVPVRCHIYLGRIPVLEPAIARLHPPADKLLRQQAAGHIKWVVFVAARVIDLHAA